MAVQFAQRARRHKVGRRRVLEVVANPYVVAVLRSSPTRVLMLGDDSTGRALEVIAVNDGGVLLIIHAMDLRSKYRNLYEEGRKE